MLSSRYLVYYATAALTLIGLILGLMVNSHFLWLFLATAPVALLGTWDILQTDQNLLRNYPILAHVRFLFERNPRELRHRSSLSRKPFSREQRALVAKQSKKQEAKVVFGTEPDIYAKDYRRISDSVAPRPPSDEAYRVNIGGRDCSQPYSASLYNISAMSFGAISANAIRALNKGAQKGGFAHDTGEGGISPYHLEFGGDLIWEIGSGYFGCRNSDGTFNPEMFTEKARYDQVKMVEIKLSQGANPGNGGVLPGAKVTTEIAGVRGVRVGMDCISPPSHSAFQTPIEFMQFISTLRERSFGKPVGFKLCVGHPWEFMSICKAMLDTNILPDFIVVDGGEGGTGAAPVEFSNHVGTPLRQGLTFVHNVLVGTNLREKIALGASGKLISAIDIANTMCLGADWCNSARGFMFAVGCIQSRRCHTNRCPVGVATQDKERQRALVISDKSERVYNFHRNTIKALSEFIAAAGLNHPAALELRHFYLRDNNTSVFPTNQALAWLEPGDLLKSKACAGYSEYWAIADATTFDCK